MKRLLRWLGRGLVGLAVLALIGYVIVYVLSERELRRVYPLPSASVAIPADAQSIAEGRRLATVRGCFQGCHGKQGEGAVLFNEPAIARLVAPNLTAAARKYSDAQLVAIIRNGLRPDGTSVFVMPSRAFTAMTDEDVGRIIAFLKTLPAMEGPAPSIALGPLGRIGVVAGKFKTEAQLIATTVPPPEPVGEEPKLGRYLARTICAHCHGTDLGGESNPAFTSPNLRVVAAYTPEAFTALMRTGIAPGGRTLTTMTPVSKADLSHLTDAEIAALYSYLHAIPDA